MCVILLEGNIIVTSKIRILSFKKDFVYSKSVCSNRRNKLSIVVVEVKTLNTKPFTPKKRN